MPKPFHSIQCCKQICESYQIIGSEYKNRLLALVGSTNTFGLFAFAASKWPPEVFSDLTIDSVYPLNDDFLLDTSKFFCYQIQSRHPIYLVCNMAPQ